MNFFTSAWFRLRFDFLEYVDVSLFHIYHISIISYLRICYCQTFNKACLSSSITHVLQVQKVYSQSTVFSSLTPGRLYLFAVRTEKESFIDSSPVTVNITAGKHTHTQAHTRTHTAQYLCSNDYVQCFLLCASSQPGGGVSRQ